MSPSASNDSETPFIQITSAAHIRTHTRFLVTLRSIEGVYKSLILFRLAGGAVTPADADEDDVFRSSVSTESRENEQESSHFGEDGLQNSVIVDANVNDAEQIYVMESACPHLGADMSYADIEECEVGVVAVCPWHRYDFDLRTGKSDTGLKACVYKVDIRPSEKDGDNYVWIEQPEEGTEWEIVEFRPVSEDFADPPTLQNTVSQLSGLSLDSELQLKSLGKDTRPPDEPVVPLDRPPKTLIQWAVLILNTAHPQLKVSRTRHAVDLFRTGKLSSIGRSGSNVSRPPEVPPRHDALKTVDPGRAGKRKGRVAMLHALANIEQWAIDLAWDIIARFGPSHPSLPHQFFSDFAKMALDESKHFTLLCARLAALGSYYGSHTVHAGLWQSATETSQSLKSRLAIIHLVHEARGLDVNPATIERFRKQGDLESVKALEIIHHDEITHVTAGHRWFTFVCAEEGLDAVKQFREEVRQHFTGVLKGPFNIEDRRKAGLTVDFYGDLRGEADWYN